MGVDGTVAQQPVMIVDIQIAARGRKEAAYPGDFVVILRQMTVDEGIRKISREFACHLELRL